MAVDSNKSQPAVTSMSISAEETDKYYTNFDFFYKRTCFRVMTEFYKLEFKTFYTSQYEKRSKIPMETYLKRFTDDYFPGLLEKMSEQEQYQFIELIKLVVHSHRHNKNDVFLKELIVDFGVVRDTMYKYSKQAQNTFFDVPVLSFLFIVFTQSEKAKKTAKEKFKGKEERHLSRIQHETLELNH